MLWCVATNFFVEFELRHRIVATRVAKLLEEQEAQLLIEYLLERVLVDFLQVFVHHASYTGMVKEEDETN